MSEHKKALREQIVRQRREMEKSVREEYDKKIYNNLMELRKIRECRTFLVYASSPDEVDTRRFITEMLESGKTVAVPKCEGRDMRFLAIPSLSALTVSKFGVDEPSYGTQITGSADTVCIVPALRFDEQGFRLGWGGGFYDRFLAGYSGCSIGICYGQCCGEVPTDDHDIPVDIVITENGVFCGNT